RLDLVIEEVEELGRVACFKEYKEEKDVILDVPRRSREINLTTPAGAE
nr:aluminum-activated malate transporter 12-like [Tanacetum cinerariifolium]